LIFEFFVTTIIHNKATSKLDNKIFNVVKT